MKYEKVCRRCSGTGVVDCSPEEMAISTIIEDCLIDGNELGNKSRGVDWWPGESLAHLEGQFTAADLRAIADFMEKTK